MNKHEARLQELSQLKPGWYDGYGKAIPATVIQATSEFIALINPDEIHQDYGIFPTEQGHILIEWFKSEKVLSAEINEHHTEIFYITKGNYTETRFLTVEEAAEHVNETITSM